MARHLFPRPSRVAMEAEAADRQRPPSNAPFECRDQRARDFRRDLVLDRDMRPPAARVLGAEKTVQIRARSRRGSGPDRARRFGTPRRRRDSSVRRSAPLAAARSQASLPGGEPRSPPRAAAHETWSSARAPGYAPADNGAPQSLEPRQVNRRNLRRKDQRAGHSSLGKAWSRSNPSAAR
jgi:hypothetical protein